jgi:pentapeptide repeat protein
VSADSEHLELLRRGPRPWNEWRRRHPTTIPNLTQISLSAGERQMGAVHGGPVNLASARLRRASLRFATLSGADLAEADLSDADLTDARLDGADLSNADLSHALLTRTDFAGAKLYRTKLNGANLEDARNLTQEQLNESSGDASTDLPKHLKSPASWMVFEAKPKAEKTATEAAPQPKENGTSRLIFK